MSEPRYNRSVVSGFRGVTAAVGALATLVAGAGAARAGPPCERVDIPVALAPGEPADLSVAGWLCAEGELEGKTLQLLVHGATYDHHMWDPPLAPDMYSYVRAATEAGYATLNIDRLGHGESSRVHGGDLDIFAGAFALHQVIQALRAGEVETDTFGAAGADTIISVGSSLGANLAWLEAATYGDVDALIVSGSANRFSTGMQVVQNLTWSVERDPDFRDQDFPPAYLTTKPNTRGALFYWNPGAESAAIQLDNELRQTVTVAENITVQETVGGLSEEVDVPTFITVGDHDWLFCDMPSCTATGSLDAELEFWADETCPELLIMPEAGHTLTLHENAPAYFDELIDWADRRVGPSEDAGPTEPCDP